jgi:hypothetical protein
VFWGVGGVASGRTVSGQIVTPCSAPAPIRFNEVVTAHHQPAHVPMFVQSSTWLCPLLSRTCKCWQGAETQQLLPALVQQPVGCRVGCVTSSTCACMTGWYAVIAAATRNPASIRLHRQHNLLWHDAGQQLRNSARFQVHITVCVFKHASTAPCIGSRPYLGRL